MYRPKSTESKMSNPIIPADARPIGSLPGIPSVSEGIEVKEVAFINAIYIKNVEDQFIKKELKSYVAALNWFAKYTHTYIGPCVLRCKKGDKNPQAEEAIIDGKKNWHWKHLTKTPEDAAYFDKRDGMGVVTKHCNVDVIDVDVGHQGMLHWQIIFAAAGLDLSKCTYEVTTSGGLHFYFKPNSKLGRIAQGTNKCIILINGDRKVETGIDTAGSSGFIRCAPSKHVSKKPKMFEYTTWIQGPHQFPMQELPEMLHKILTGAVGINYDSATRKVSTYSIVQRLARRPRQEEVDVFGDPLVHQKYKALTKKQMYDILMGIDASHATGYIDWIKVIAIVAHWADDNEIDRDWVIKVLLMDFSKRSLSGDVADEDQIIEKYDSLDQFHERQANVGTLIAMLREENPEAFKDLFLPPAVGVFDKSDYYYSSGFIRDLGEQGTFEDAAAALKFLQGNLHRVMAIISGDSAGYIIKQHQDKIFGIQKNLHELQNPAIFYKAIEAGKEVTKNTPLSMFIQKFLPHLPRYDGVDVYADGARPKNMFNIWLGFKAKRVKANMKFVQPWLTYIKEVLANDDEKTFEYLLNWLANMFQYPGEMNEVALVLYGPEGCGKSTLANFLHQFCLGSELTVAYPNVEAIVGKFNTLMAGKKLGVLHELLKCDRDGKKDMELLKQFITEVNQKIEPKGKDAIMIKSILCWMFITNHIDCMHLTPNQRRIVAVTCSSRYMGNHEYWADFRTKHFNQEHADHLVSWFIDEYKMTYKPRQIIKTELTKEIIDRNVSYTDKFVDFMVHLTDECKLDKKVTAKNLHKIYEMWCRHELINIEPMKPVPFGKELTGQSRIAKKRVTSGMAYDFTGCKAIVGKDEHTDIINDSVFRSSLGIARHEGEPSVPNTPAPGELAIRIPEGEQLLF